MAAYQGRLGKVEIDPAGTPATILEVTQFNYTTDAEEIPVSAYGDIAQRFLDGLQASGGDFSMNWDDLDATGQEALSVGTVVGLAYYPRGDTDTPLGFLTSVGNLLGDTVIILGEDVSGPVDGVVTRVYRYRGFLVRDTLP